MQITCNKGCGHMIELPDNAVSAIEMLDVEWSYGHHHCPPPGDTYAMEIKIIRRAGGFTGSERDAIVAAIGLHPLPYEIVVAEDDNLRDKITAMIQDKWQEMMGRMIVRDHAAIRLQEKQAQDQLQALQFPPTEGPST